MRVTAFICALLLATAANAEVLVGKVVGVADGDTITVLDANNQQHKIRLMGIDAPEKRQPYGQQSKMHLADQVFQRQVTVEWNKRDRYGRVVGKVLVEGKDANLRQVRDGMAWWYRQYAKEQPAQDRRAYEEAEADAQARRQGLWNDTSPIPPWAFRQAIKR